MTSAAGSCLFTPHTHTHTHPPHHCTIIHTHTYTHHITALSHTHTPATSLHRYTHTRTRARAHARHITALLKRSSDFLSDQDKTQSPHLAHESSKASPLRTAASGLLLLPALPVVCVPAALSPVPLPCPAPRAQDRGPLPPPVGGSLPPRQPPLLSLTLLLLLLSRSVVSNSL